MLVCYLLGSYVLCLCVAGGERVLHFLLYDIVFFLFLFIIFSCYVRLVVVFFFQAEDGIRDTSVTGVQTCALPIEASIGAVRLSVIDNGIGIAPEHQARIFRIFERLHAASEYPGLGIGLALVRKSVDRMGGTVGVESSPGRGSRFWIELPGAD